MGRKKMFFRNRLRRWERLRVPRRAEGLSTCMTSIEQALGVKRQRRQAPESQ